MGGFLPSLYSENSTMQKKSRPKFVSTEAFNNHAETSLSVTLFGITLGFQYVKSVRYVGITVGSSAFRLSMYVMPMPLKSCKRDKFHSVDRKSVIGKDAGVVTVEHQFGMARIFGTEYMRIVKTGGSAT